MRNSFLVRAATILPLGFGLFAPLKAQNTERCFLLCRPELKIEPTFTVENLFSRHRVAHFEGGEQVGVVQAEREVVFETILALDIPTEIPRVGFTFETIFIPFAPQSERAANGGTGQELARTSIRKNERTWSFSDPKTLDISTSSTRSVPPGGPKTPALRKWRSS